MEWFHNLFFGNSSFWGGGVAHSVLILALVIALDVYKRQQRYERFRSYGSSKLALLLFTLELARRTAGRIGVYPADPGVVDTGMITMHRWFDPLTDLLFRPLIKTCLTDRHRAAVRVCREPGVRQRRRMPDDGTF